MVKGDRMFRLVLVMLSVVLVGGCASTAADHVQANDPSFAPVIPEMPREQIVEDGGLFRPRMANSLYSDVTARRVGDIITVTLSENTNASKSAGTTSSKQTGVDVQPITGLGGNALNIGNQSIQLGVNASNDFSGDAQANQSNSLNGSISVTVVDVLANQNLVIRGEKWLTLNHGDEYIRLTGIIRASDISPENEILSTRIANARIQYSGTGSFARSQEKGWLTKFFSSEWWPF